MARKPLSPEELHARAYDSYDFPDEFEEEDPDDDLADEMDDYIRGVMNAPDPSAVSGGKKPAQ